MKRIIFTLMRIFTFCCLFEGLSATFAGCQNSLISDEEEVEFILPEWKAGGELPQLSRWKICARSADFEKVFFLAGEEKSFSFTLKLNEPFSLTAFPLTRLSDGGEVSFFKPAGALYPYFAGGDFYSGKVCCQLSWEGGFSADAMQKIIRNRKESGLSSEELKRFLMQFNWKKMQEKINQNIEQSILSFESQGESKPKFYNPWHIDSALLLEKLSSAIFESRYLNTSYVFTVEEELVGLQQDKTLLSSFLPENQIIQKYHLLTLKKNTPQAYIIENTYAVTLSASSAKKLSADLSYLPILTEDYEHSD